MKIPNAPNKNVNLNLTNSVTTLIGNMIGLIGQSNIKSLRQSQAVPSLLVVSHWNN